MILKLAATGTHLLTLEALLLAFATPLSFDGYLLEQIYPALGRPLCFHSFELSGITPTHSTLILSLLICAFNASSVISSFYRITFEASGGALAPKMYSNFTLQVFIKLS